MKNWAMNSNHPLLKDWSKQNEIQGGCDQWTLRIALKALIEGADVSEEIRSAYTPEMPAAVKNSETQYIGRVIQIIKEKASGEDTRYQDLYDNDVVYPWIMDAAVKRKKLISKAEAMAAVVTGLIRTTKELSSTYGVNSEQIKESIAKTLYVARHAIFECFEPIQSEKSSAEFKICIDDFYGFIALLKPVPSEFLVRKFSSGSSEFEDTASLSQFSEEEKVQISTGYSLIQRLRKNQNELFEQVRNVLDKSTDEYLTRILTKSFPGQNQNGIAQISQKQAQLVDGYYRQYNSRPSRDLVHLITSEPLQMHMDMYGNQSGLFVSEDKKTSVTISNIEHLVRSNTAVILFDYAHRKLAENGKKSLMVTFKTGEYAKARGISRIAARKQIERDVLLLGRISISFTKKEKNKILESGVLNPFQLTHINESGVVTIHFSEKFADELSPLLYMPDTIMKVDLNARRYTYRMCRAISEHIEMNCTDSNSGTISVKTLLRACDFAKYDEGKSRHYEDRILTPFTENMDEISRVAPKFKWHFRVNGSTDRGPETYAEFIDSMIIFSWPDHPTCTRTIRKIK